MELRHGQSLKAKRFETDEPILVGMRMCRVSLRSATTPPPVAHDSSIMVVLQQHRQ